MSHRDPGIGWARRVRKEKIRRLYQTDAQGIYDEELIDEVGWALYARCESLLAAEEARAGRAKCHRCGALIQHTARKDEQLQCESCGWEISWADYFRSIQGKQLSGPDLVELFKGYVGRFPGATTPREKMLLIDRLIHGFHWSLKTGPRRPAAINLIQGKLSEVVRFLDGLTYGDGSTKGTRDTYQAWRDDMNRALASWGGPTLEDRPS